MKSIMTSRKRLITVLKGGRADRIPWSPLVEGFFLSGLHGKPDLIEILTEIGADMMVRKVPVYVSNIFRPYEISEATRASVPTGCLPKGIEVIESKQDNKITRIYKTPKGSLQEGLETTPYSSAIPFPTEYLIKNKEDIKIYRYLVEREEITPYFDIFESKEKVIGDKGLATAVVPHTPMQHLLIIHMGVANFYYTLNDYKEELVGLMNDMHQRNLGTCRIIADSPAEVAIEYENTGTTYVSPEIYKKYEKPAMDEYGKILHKADKIFLVHMCGQIKLLADLIKAGEQDGISDIAPFPTGDWDLKEAYETLSPEQLIVGGLDSIKLRSGSAEEIVNYTRNILDELKPGKGLILGNGDSILQGTPVENLKAVTKTVKQYG